MPQLFFSVERPVADELARRAAIENLPLSQYLTRIVREQVQTDWPDGYLSSVVGGCAEDPLQEPGDEPPDEIALHDDTCAAHYGLLRADLASRGTPIGANDMMIAAIARHHDLSLVTNNVGEFSRIIGLRVEDWERP